VSVILKEVEEEQIGTNYDTVLFSTSMGYIHPDVKAKRSPVTFTVICNFICIFFSFRASGRNLVIYRSRNRPETHVLPA
jgi:hypothetical protein